VTLSAVETLKLIENAGKSYFDIKVLDAAGEGQLLRIGRGLIISGVIRMVT